MVLAAADDNSLSDDVPRDGTQYQPHDITCIPIWDLDSPLVTKVSIEAQEAAIIFDPTSHPKLLIQNDKGLRVS